VNLTDQLVRDEGCKSYAYQDSLGYWTIGIGTCIDRRVGCGLTNDEILLLFKNRVALAKAALAQEFPWTTALDEVRLGALENLTFAMGVKRLAAFQKFLGAMRIGDWCVAHDELINSLYAKEEPERAARLALQIQKGEWQ